MRDVIAKTQVAYIGGDIVPEVIELARRNAVGLKAEFMIHDIVEGPFPEVDLWICRDCLFHFSYRNIYKTLERFCDSKIKYVLMTTHTQPNIRNMDIVTGDFRLLDLFSHPFNLTRETLADIEDFVAPWPPRKMVLLSREQVAESLRKRRMGRVKRPGQRQAIARGANPHEA